MSAPNFCVMDEFPLFVVDDQYMKRCPCCGLYMDAEAEECEECGASLEDVEAEYDDFMTNDLFSMIQQDIKDNAPYLEFFEVTVQGGYYTGMQLYVEDKHDCFPEQYDNDDCHYYFDCCRSRAIRKRAAEVRKVEKYMRKIARQYGMDEYYCGGIFSNGEAVYDKVPDQNATQREKLKYALAVG